MARVVVGGYMVRYPLGGMLSNSLEYLVALRRLGHDVSFVERAGYQRSCFDVSRNEMSDDPTYGLGVVGGLLARFGIDRWSYLDAAGRAHGPAASQWRGLLDQADLFIDYGAHGTWSAEAEGAGARILIDGEPGYNQIDMERRKARGDALASYDHYFTNGMNLGTDASAAPTAGHTWHHLFHPVNLNLHDAAPPRRGAPFTTVMNWQSRPPIEHAGVVYGQKDIEFRKFESLPALLEGEASFELAVGGPEVPVDALRHNGWQVRDGHQVTLAYDDFIRFIDESAGEFSLCKNVFVALNTGWFSDRSAVYLARGRPVVMQDTGFSEHLPTGEGLFAVRTVDEAVAAFESVLADPVRQSRRARELAAEHLDGPKVMRAVLATAGIA